MKTLTTILLTLGIVFVGWNLAHEYYIATHCTTILGTQVCDTSHPMPNPTPNPPAEDFSPNGPNQNLGGTAEQQSERAKK